MTTTADATGRLSIACQDMDEWIDIGDGLEARKADETVEVRSTISGDAWRHDLGGRLVAFTKEQAVNTAARPPDWTAVGGAYESRYQDDMYQVRGSSVSGMVRHDEHGRLASVGVQAMSQILLLSQ